MISFLWISLFLTSVWTRNWWNISHRSRIFKIRLIFTLFYVVIIYFLLIRIMVFYYFSFYFISILIAIFKNIILYSWGTKSYKMVLKICLLLFLFVILIKLFKLRLRLILIWQRLEHFFILIRIRVLQFNLFRCLNDITIFNFTNLLLINFTIIFSNFFAI